MDLPSMNHNYSPRLKSSKTPPDPFELSSYDLDWDLDFSSLDINWNASTVKRLTQFYTAAFAERRTPEVLNPQL